jgi:VanZ family protein
VTPRQSRSRVILAWLPAALYTLLIWWLSSQTIELALIERVPLRDKGVHFLEYGALGLFIAHAVTTTWPGRAIGSVVAVLITASLGLLDELHQAFVPGRTSELLDLTADTLGAMAAAAIHALVLRLARPGGGRSVSADVLPTPTEDAGEGRPSHSGDQPL